MTGKPWLRHPKRTMLLLLPWANIPMLLVVMFVRGLRWVDPGPEQGPVYIAILLLLLPVWGFALMGAPWFVAVAAAERCVLAPRRGLAVAGLIITATAVNFVVTAVLLE